MTDDERALELFDSLTVATVIENMQDRKGDRQRIVEAFAAVRADEREECAKVEAVAASPEMDAARALSLAHYCREHASADACTEMILAIFKRLRGQGRDTALAKVAELERELAAERTFAAQVRCELAELMKAREGMASSDAWWIIDRAWKDAREKVSEVSKEGGGNGEG